MPWEPKASNQPSITLHEEIPAVSESVLTSDTRVLFLQNKQVCHRQIINCQSICLNRGMSKHLANHSGAMIISTGAFSFCTSCVTPIRKKLKQLHSFAMS